MYRLAEEDIEVFYLCNLLPWQPKKCMLPMYISSTVRWHITAMVDSFTTLCNHHDENVYHPVPKPWAMYLR